MRWYTHLVFGIFIGILWVSLFGISNKYLFFSVVAVASLFPDIDHPESKLGRKVKPISWLVNKVFGHRGFLHSIWPIVILYVVFVYVLGWRVAGIGLAVGGFAHLMSDAFTIMGVNFTHPLRAKVSGFIKTGGLSEMVFFIIFLILDIVKWKVIF